MFIILAVILLKMWNERIRELREDRDLSQSDVARLLNTTQQVYSRYEKAINELPLHHLRTLCLYYNVSADYILGLTDKKHDVSANSNLISVHK